MRIFISIEIPEQIKKEIRKIQDNLPEFYGKKTEENNLHLTLKFLGEVDEKKLDKIKRKLREIKFNGFSVEINSIGIFSEKFVKIIWLHLSEVEELQKKIDERLKDLFEPEKRFMSHLTIARVRNINDKKRFLEELKKIKIPKINFKVNSFELKKSILTKKGAIYKSLEKYNLERI